MWVKAQDDYAGRDFWFTTLTGSQLSPPDSALLYVVSDTACTGVVENPNTNYNQTFSVVPGNVTIIRIPSSVIQCNPVALTDPPAIENKGFHLRTSRNVCTYLQTRTKDSLLYSKKCPLIPTHHLSDRISIKAFSGGNSAATQILIVALEDNTVLNYHSTGPPQNFTLHLNKGQVAVIRKKSQGNIQIQTNCKKIACYLGGDLNNILFPALNAHLYYGVDFILKKNGNNRFSKKYVAYTTSHMGLCFCNHFGTPNYMGQSGTILCVYEKVQCNVTLPHLIDVPFAFIRLLDQQALLHFVENMHLGFLDYNYEYAGTGDEQVIVHSAYTDNVYLGKNTMPNLFPNDIMVKKWVIPTTRRNVRSLNYSLDTTFADLQIYVHENGIHTTSLNGQLLPASVFDTVPFTNRDYWVAQFGYYNDSIPEIIRVENPNGFSA